MTSKWSEDPERRRDQAGGVEFRGPHKANRQISEWLDVNDPIAGVSPWTSRAPG